MFHRTRCGWELSRHLGLRWGRLWSGRRSLSGYQIRELISYHGHGPTRHFACCDEEEPSPSKKATAEGAPGSYGPSGQAMAEVEAATRQLGR